MTVYLDCEGVIELLERAEYVALDTETTGEDIRDGRGYLIGLSVAYGELSGYLPVRHINELDGSNTNITDDQRYRLTKAIENYKGWLIFHNAKFDLESLRSAGINYTGKFYDTMLMAHLINENKPYSKSLDGCIRHYVGEDSKKKSEAFLAAQKIWGWNMPASVMYEYAAYDAVLTFRLFEAIKPLFDKEELAETWEHKQKFIRAIIAMERRGVKVDVNLAKRMQIHGEMIMDDIREELRLNPGSTKDLKVLLIDKLGLPVVKATPAGAPSFDKEAMAIYDRALELQENHTAELITAYRGWQKSVSSNYIPYQELLSPDGRLRPNYKLHGTITGRMSCEKPNLQQIPRSGDKAWNGEMKSTFIPEDGYELYEADYSQLELRLGTAYAGEEGLKRIFAEGRDVFTEMSNDLGMSRQNTKTLVYTIQYGGGINRISTVFAVSRDRAEQLRENYFATYPGFHAVASVATQKAKHVGKLKLWSGRYRHFLYPREEAHKAFNSVIQGGAADIVERTMVRCFESVDNDDECRMLLQVHDSIVWEIKKDKVDKYLPMIKEVMTNIEPDFGVTFAVDIHKFGE